MSNLPGFILAYGSYVAALHLVEGPWKDWKKGGPSAVDKWTATHIAWGAIGQAFGLSHTEITALAAVNEVGEYVVRGVRPDLLWGSPETTANVAIDIAATSAGWWLASAILGGKKSGNQMHDKQGQRVGEVP